MEDYKVCPLLCIFQDRKIYNLIYTYQNLRRIDSPTPHLKLQIVNNMYCNALHYYVHIRKNEYH